jgi:hypothetical protein
VSIVATIAAIQAVNLTIAGVSTADSMLRATFNDTDLPLVEARDGDGVYDEQAYGLPRLYSSYRLFFFVAPVSLGQGIDQGYQAALALKDAALVVWNAVGADYTILNGAVEQIGSLGGQGQKKAVSAVGHLTKNGTDYWGFSLTIPAQEKA